MENNTINLPGGGFVTLDSHNADDLSVVNSARVSFGKKVDQLSDGDEKLINFLMRERHGTPFEHNMFRFHIQVPIFVAREWFRHRIGWSYNELSGRYSKLESQYWVPELEDVRTQIGKPGAYTFEPVEPEIAEKTRKAISEVQSSCWRTYNYLLKLGVAKEVARAVLPVGFLTEFYATCNARSLMSFLSLRAEDNAQLEIRRAAYAVEELFSQVMPITYECFQNNGRTAP